MGGKAPQMQFVVEKHRSNFGTVKQVLHVVVDPLQRIQLGLQLRVHGQHFLVHRLHFFLGNEHFLICELALFMTGFERFLQKLYFIAQGLYFQLGLLQRFGLAELGNALAGMRRRDVGKYDDDLAAQCLHLLDRLHGHIDRMRTAFACYL